jgi:hypothetical protein
MSEPVSDAAVEILGVCRHSLRFSFGAPLDYPYATAKPAANNPPPALFRRVQVSSPPPKRDDAPWETGLTNGDVPLDPALPASAKLEVTQQEGAVALGMPDPEDIVLDWWFSVPRARATLTFPSPDGDIGFRSVPYWSPPAPAPGQSTTQQVEYFATHRLDWARTPRDPWIAISFDGFFPPERDSADLIARVGECDNQCPTD